MAAKTERVDSGNGATELSELNQIRLSRNWSYAQLAADMGRLGFAVGPKTLHPLLTGDDPRPYDRTLYQIRGYLNAVRDESAEPAKKRRAS